MRLNTIKTIIFLSFCVLTSTAQIIKLDKCCQKIVLSTKIDSLILDKTTIKQAKRMLGKPNSKTKYRNSGTGKHEEQMEYDSLSAQLTFYDDTLQCIFIVRPKKIKINDKLFLKADTLDILNEFGTKKGGFIATYGKSKVLEYYDEKCNLLINFTLDGLFVGYRIATRKYDELPFIVR